MPYVAGDFGTDLRMADAMDSREAMHVINYRDPDVTWDSFLPFYVRKLRLDCFVVPRTGLEDWGLQLDG